MAALNDDILMARVVCGDVQAFGLIVKAHQARMQRFAYHMLRDREAARDVVQDSFVRVWQARSSYSQGGGVTAFFLRVVRNACIDHLRANKKWNAVRLDDDVPFEGLSCEANALSSALHEAINQVLIKLPETQRAVFVLSEYEGLTYPEIADVLGCPYGTVSSRKHAVMEALRTHLRLWNMGEEES